MRPDPGPDLPERGNLVAVFDGLFSGPDFREGTQAFLEKRPPRF
jgi:enoyl-CoA hydratase/carnithine racemase